MVRVMTRDYMMRGLHGEGDDERLHNGNYMMQGLQDEETT